MVDTMNNDVPIRWLPKDSGIDAIPEYVFQIGDGVPEYQLRRLFEVVADNRFFLVMAQDQPFLDKNVRDLGKKFRSEDLGKISFISVKEFRTSMETSLSKIIFGSAVLGSKVQPNVKQKGSMPNLEMKTGLTIVKIGKDLGYNTRNPSENVFTWYLPGDKIKVLEVVVGDGFKTQLVKKLNNSGAKKNMYIAVKLYGDPYKKAVDNLLRSFPDTMIEFMSVAEIDNNADLESLLRKRLEGDVKVKKKIQDMKPKKDLFAGW